MRQSRTPASFRANAQKLVDLRVREARTTYAAPVSRQGLTGIGRCPTPASFRAGAQKLVYLRVRENANGLASPVSRQGLEHRWRRSGA